MPGIVGLITKMPREWAERELLRMVEALRHESFYATGTWLDEPLGVYVGWAARKNSFSDGMPLRNERGDVVLVFSGEEFPEPGTARRLKERGHALDDGGTLLSRPPLRGGSRLSSRLERTVPRVLDGPDARNGDRSSTTATGCTGSTITSRRRPSISPRKPRRSLRSVRNSGGRTLGLGRIRRLRLRVGEPDAL